MSAFGSYSGRIRECANFAEIGPNAVILAGSISYPQHFVPPNVMPEKRLTREDATAIAAYLSSLR
jgi:hypothetical protein